MSTEKPTEVDGSPSDASKASKVATSSMMGQKTGEDGAAGNGNKAASFWPRNCPIKCWHETGGRTWIVVEVLRAAVAHDQPSQYNYMIYTSVGMEGPAKF